MANDIRSVEELEEGVVPAPVEPLSDLAEEPEQDIDEVDGLGDVQEIGASKPRPTVLRIQDPEAFRIPAIRALFFRAFAKADFGSGNVDPFDAILWAALNVRDDNIHLTVAQDETGDFRGLMITSAHTSIFSDVPFSMYIYSDGGYEVRNTMGDSMEAWLRSKGHNRVRALNVSGEDDELYINRISPGYGKVICSLIEFKLTPEGEGDAWRLRRDDYPVEG